MTSRLSRRMHFECVHQYGCEAWSETQNHETFGACYTPHGHGHSYVLEVQVEGELDPETGMVLNLRDLDALLKEVLLNLQNKHLNFEVPEFKDKMPTTENIAQFIFKKLKSPISVFKTKLVQVRLYESEDLWVDVIA